jgi:uncharacterized protein YxjI
MNCPKCGFTQPQSDTCARCGIVVARFRARSEVAAEAASAAVPSRDDAFVGAHQLEHFLTAARRLTVEQQVRHWWEVLFDWEQRNEYYISGGGGGHLASMVEQGTGLAAILSRMFLGSHRSLEVIVFSGSEGILELTRPFYFVNSSLTVSTAVGERLGRVESRLALLHRHYDLYDESDRVFATIESPRWRPWTFPIFDPSGTQQAVIAKKWGGLTKEYFTDADTFGLDFGSYEWTLSQRAVIVGAMISIDYDYFENNEGNNN